MSIKKIYKSRLGASVFVTRNGVSCHFIDGKFITDDEVAIMELEAEIRKSHPHLFIDPAESEIDTTLQDAIQEAQREAALKVIAEFNQKQQESSSVSKQDATVQAQQPAMMTAAALNVATTNSLAAMTSSNASGPSALGTLSGPAGK